MGKVLVVDDEEPIGIYLSRLIGSVKKTELGQVSAHEVKVVFTASDAFAALDAGTFGMVIADLRLPDAPDTALWVSQLCQKAGKARVVLISGMIPSPELDL
ncbi:MAG: hypothetical protein LBW77_04360, partial [Verrucomicrobiota bacterium]|nr:hypothetical protein [Verrucomicrobiota bacterium]